MYSYLKDSDDTRLRARAFTYAPRPSALVVKNSAEERSSLGRFNMLYQDLTNRARAWQSHGDEQKSSAASKNRNKGSTSKSKRKKGAREKNNDGQDKHARP